MPISDHVDYPESEHQSRVMCGDPKACAWEWIVAYAKNLSGVRSSGDDDYYSAVTADELIDTGLSVARGRYEYITKGGLLEGTSTDPTFWNKLAILKDTDIPQKNRNNFFSCSC